MPARTKARKKQLTKAQRRPRGPTQFPGSAVFAAEINRDHSHLHRVLSGERTSQSLVNRFNEWLRARNMPWPTAAKAKPTN